MANEIGIDLGTSNTIIYLRGKGIVVNEPTVVAVSRATGKILSIGKEAGEMLGRTPLDICAVTPIKEGVIANFDITVAMLKYFIKKAVNTSFLKPKAVVCIPSHITDVEKRAVRDAALAAGVKEVFLLEKSMAAAIGAGIAVNAPVGSMIVDIGGGTTEIAVVSLGGIVATQSLKVASQTFDNDIIQYLKRNHINNCPSSFKRVSILQRSHPRVLQKSSVKRIHCRKTALVCDCRYAFLTLSRQ